MWAASGCPPWCAFLGMRGLCWLWCGPWRGADLPGVGRGPGGAQNRPSYRVGGGRQVLGPGPHPPSGNSSPVQMHEAHSTPLTPAEAKHSLTLHTPGYAIPAPLPGPHAAAFTLFSLSGLPWLRSCPRRHPLVKPQPPPHSLYFCAQTCGLPRIPADSPAPTPADVLRFSLILTLSAWN